MRPFLVALAYLLAGFDDFQHLGMFNRLHLAQLVFGAGAVGAATEEATAVLDRWGYRSQVRDGEYKLPGVLGQALLINRSPRLADLTTEAFTRLLAHPAASGRQHQATLYALQRGSPRSATAIRRYAPATTTRPASREPIPHGPGGSSGGTPPRR